MWRTVLVYFCSASSSAQRANRYQLVLGFLQVVAGLVHFSASEEIFGSLTTLRHCSSNFSAGGNIGFHLVPFPLFFVGKFAACSVGDDDPGAGLPAQHVRGGLHFFVRCLSGAPLRRLVLSLRQTSTARSRRKFQSYLRHQDQVLRCKCGR